MTASWLWRCCSRSCRRRSRSLSCLRSVSSSILSASVSSAAAAISPAALLSAPDVLLHGNLDGGLLTGLPDHGRLCLDSCIQTTCSWSHEHRETARAHSCPTWHLSTLQRSERMAEVHHKLTVAHGMVWVCTAGRILALEAIMLCRPCLHRLVPIDTSCRLCQAMRLSQFCLVLSREHMSPGSLCYMEGDLTTRLQQCKTHHRTCCWEHGSLWPIKAPTSMVFILRGEDTGPVLGKPWL